MEKDTCVFYFFNDSVNKIKKKKPIHKLVINNFFAINELTNIKKIRENKMNFYVCENSA